MLNAPDSVSTFFYSVFAIRTKGAFGWYDLEQDRTAGAH